MNRWLKLGLLFLVAVVGTQLLLRRPRTAVNDGATAPPLALQDLGGRTIDLESLRGRVVLVNFWATWCPPCRAELPELAELWQDHKGGCLEVLGVAEQSPPADLQAASRSIPYPILTDPRGDAATAWSVFGFPSSFLVDPSGKVVRVFEGAVSKRDVLDAMRPHLPASCKGT
ncbi:MAG TPA: TlpA disulfide reductase family protein [Anaeromyxobacteraceae bacterium]|nr:TlpA disulfide reductase family protein [Anaeromyxobacteraceae bacterium]